MSNDPHHGIGNAQVQMLQPTILDTNQKPHHHPQASIRLQNREVNPVPRNAIKRQSTTNGPTSQSITECNTLLGSPNSYSTPLISCPFWQYSDLYSSPYFVPSQEPAFRPVLYLWTCFGPSNAISDQSPPAHYFRISGLPLVLFPLAPPT